MKIIPKKDLLWLIQTTAINYYSLGDVEAMFEEFGDDYFVSESNHSVLELSKENEARKKRCPK